MNNVRQIQELNRRELENSVSPEASWHTDYRDTAYIYIGGLPFELTEGDVITMFSQFGEPTFVNLVRDKETGKSRGFAFLKYEDQRSTDLAVDNLGGTQILGRTLRVDHTRYKKKDDELEGEQTGDEPTGGKSRNVDNRASDAESEKEMLKEEYELQKLIQEHDDDDPMKAFLIQEKKDELAVALTKRDKTKRSDKSHRHRRRHHTSRRDSDDSGNDKDTRSRHLHHRSDRRDQKRFHSRERSVERTKHYKEEGSSYRKNDRSSRRERSRSRNRDSYGDSIRRRSISPEDRSQNFRK